MALQGAELLVSQEELLHWSALAHMEEHWYVGWDRPAVDWWTLEGWSVLLHCHCWSGVVDRVTQTGLLQSDRVGG